VLTIQLLGLPQVRRDGLRLTLARRTSRARLYYLAAHPRQPTRDQAAALPTLRTRLPGLRRALEQNLAA